MVLLSDIINDVIVDGGKIQNLNKNILAFLGNTMDYLGLREIYR